MAEIDFPDTPAPGEVYDQWTWNGELWVLTPPPPPPPDKLGFTFVQDAMPTATRAGDTWWQGLSGASYVWVVDANSSQWVQFAPSAPTTGPVGTIVDFIGTAAPTGWLTMIGQTIASGQTFYPALWAVLPASMKSGTSIVLPDTRGRVTVGVSAGDPAHATPGAIGGAKTHTLTVAELASHLHDVIMPGTLGQQSQHIAGDYGGAGSTAIPNTVAFAGGSFAYANYTGGGAAHNNMQPFVSFLKILRVV